jgi:Pyridine nucleotide-disulphide oxidoreductase
VVVVGAGPAGMAVLLAARKDGRLAEMLQRGLLVIEQSAHIGRGQIGSYAINSDSTGHTFVDSLQSGSDDALNRLLETPLAQRIAAAGTNAVPLCDAGELLSLIGDAMHGIICKYPQSAVLTCCTAESAKRRPDEGWQVIATDAQGSKLTILTKHLILATGGSQPKIRLEQELVAGMSVSERWGDRLMQSGEVIGTGGLARVAARLEGKVNPRVAILGGSASGMSVAHTLLHRLPEVEFGKGGVTLLHRRPLRVYYTSSEEAIADGYTEFGPGDLCPLTNRVYRLAGLRLDSRELLMQLRGIGGRPVEPRMKLHMLKQEDPEAVRLIDSADLVVAALGYRPNALRLLDEDDAEISLFAHTGPAAPLVDSRCRVMDGKGEPIAGLFGIGLAAGFVPRGKLGGEPSFTGQANGLWLWQNDIGSMIVEAVLPVSPGTPGKLPVVSRKRAAHRSSGRKVAVVAGTGSVPR